MKIIPFVHENNVDLFHLLKTVCATKACRLDTNYKWMEYLHWSWTRTFANIEVLRIYANTKKH